MQNKKYTATMGNPSLESGVVSATNNINTVTANIRVTDNPIRSPESKSENEKKRENSWIISNLNKY